MATKKSPSTKNNPQNPNNPKTLIQILKEATCPTSTGKSTLGYQIQIDEAGDIFIAVTSNSGGGFFTVGEQIAYRDLRAALDSWPDDQALTSMALRKLYKGKSANNPGFLCAVLVAEGLLAPVSGKTRVQQVCDPGPFLAQVKELKATAAGASPGAKPKAEAKTKTVSCA